MVLPDGDAVVPDLDVFVVVLVLVTALLLLCLLDPLAAEDYTQTLDPSSAESQGLKQTVSGMM